MSEEWLTSAPLPASVCPNCGGYYLAPGCVCGWVNPAAVIVTDDDDEDVDEPTTDEPTQPELPPVSDPPGGEAGV